MIDFIGSAKRTDAPEVEVATQKWGQAFLDCGKMGMRGFGPCHFTPYAHILMTHSAAAVAEFGGLRRFNGEALEKTNDEFKKCHLRRTNCRDIVTSLQVQKRRELAIRNRALRLKAKNAGKPVKMGCQACNDVL